MGNRESIFTYALDVLECTDIDEKCQLVKSMSRCWQQGLLRHKSRHPPKPVFQPGRPDRPELVHPSGLSRRSLHTAEGRGVLMHAIAHIEFNAINLACDAVYRFRDLPENYYKDWTIIAEEEARHFEMVCRYLLTQDIHYGDYPAHNGLWDMAEKTADDILLRMALVPRVMEARGLDVTPGMIDGFRNAGDAQAAAILSVIYEEEIGHVAAGSRWFQYVCNKRGVQPAAQFCRIVNDYARGLPRKPFNFSARRHAGFEELELEFIQSYSESAKLFQGE